jgi:CRP-like cAMP-binding protein
MLREIGPGGFFGELAALDWGAGFGYARTADAVARGTCTLLTLAPTALAEVLRRAPELDRTLRSAARARVQEL